MKNISIGEKLKIQSYKHNGLIYREWEGSFIIDDNETFLVCANNNALVTEVDGNKWHTKEPAIIFFFKNNWFNVIAQFKKSGIHYYCNMASPYVIDEGCIKYIDYDLDMRVYPDKSFVILDKNEYNFHKKSMKYGKDIEKIIKHELSNLIDNYKNKIGPFDSKVLHKYYNIYNLVAKNKTTSTEL